jgi:hypothetical protein
VHFLLGFAVQLALALPLPLLAHVIIWRLLLLVLLAILLFFFWNYLL